MSVSPGSRLGHYEIVAPLGAGGMGEVFRARDGKRFLGLTPAAGGDPSVSNQLHVVLNWFEELRARTPLK